MSVKSANKTLYVDIDDTIAMHDLSAFPKEQQVAIHCYEEPMVVVPNVKNINLMIKFYKLGYTVIFWSRTGSEWARAVAETLGIENYAELYLDKPSFYLDDKEVNYWIGPRVYRDPITGESI